MRTEQTLSVGIDLVELKRFAVRFQVRGFRDKVFTPAEQVLCDGAVSPPRRYAEWFAIKEAFMKALGAGIRQGVWFTQIEVDDRRPVGIRPSGRAAEIMANGRMGMLCCTVSHDGGYVTAVVVMTRQEAADTRAQLGTISSESNDPGTV